MKKLTLVLLSLFAVVFSSCTLFDSVFYKAEDVSVSELSGSFEGTTPATKEEAMSMMINTGDGAGIMSTLSAVSKASPALEKAMTGLKFLVAPNMADAQSLLPATVTTNLTVSTTNIDASFTVVDEWVVPNQVKVNANGFLKGMVNSAYQPTYGTGSFEVNLKVNAQDINGTNYANTYAVSIPAALLKFVGKGNGEFRTKLVPTTYGYTNVEPTSLNYYLALSLRYGMVVTVSDIANNVKKGGKFILKADVYLSDNFDEQKISNFMALPYAEQQNYLNERYTVSVSLDVYDNNNQLVKSFTYTDEDVADGILP